MALIECPECGGKVSDKAPACIHCGFPLNEKKNKKFCPYCGKENNDTSDFCVYCGKSFIQVQDSAPIVYEEDRLTSIKDINDLTNENEMLKLERQKVELERKQYDSMAKCPKCGSVSLAGGKKGFGVGKAVAGAVLAGGIGLLAGGIGANKTLVTCMNCGYKFNL